MKVLVDTNVVLDLLLARVPHVADAARLFQWVDAGQLPAALCATTLTTVHYLSAKALGRDEARRHVATLLEMFALAPVQHSVLRAALALDFTDFEDAVLHEAAREAGCTAIVTRNVRDFARASLPIFSPADFVAAWPAGRPAGTAPGQP